jgi:potassium efflux system protein
MTRPALWPLFLLFLLAAGDSGAQPTEPVPASVADRVVRLRDDLGRATDLDEAVRQEAQRALEAAQRDDDEAGRLLLQARAWRDGRSARAADASRLQAELAEEAAEAFRRWREELPARATPEDLSRRLVELRAASEQAALELAAITAELGSLAGRPAELAAALAQLRQQLAATPATDAAAGGDTLPQRALQLGAAAARRLSLARQQQLEAEQATLPERRRLLELRQRALERRATLLERQIDVLEAMLAERSEAELGTLAQRLRAERAELEGEDTALVAAAERNLALGEELGESAAEAREAAEQARSAQRAGAQAAEALRNTRTRLELGAGDEGVGLILLSERRRLEEPDQIARELQAARRRLARVQLRLLDLDEQRDRLDAPEQAVEEALRALESEDPAETERLRRGLGALLATRAELLPRLEGAQRDLADALGQLERALQEQLAGARELVRILDRQLLWIPSHEAISTAWLRRQAEGWADLFKPARYATSLRLLRDAVQQRWPIALLGALLFAGLLALRRRIPTRLEELAQPLMRVRTDRYRHTARALLLTLLAALPWPLLLAVLGWLLQRAGEAGKFSDSLGTSFFSLAGGVLLWQALRWLARERGLGHLHFRWTRARRAALRAALPWMAFGLLPLQWLLTLAFVRGQEPAVDAAARLMLLLFCAVGALLSWRLLAPGALWSPRSTAQVEPARLRQLLRGLLPLLLGWLALLALNGYVLTAGVMLRSLWLSASAVLGVAVLNAMIARWFLLGERRLALKRLEHKREVEAAGGATDRSGATGDAMPEPEPEEVTLESVSAQTRRLLRALTIALLAVALLWVWSDVLPALARLDDIALWNTSSVDAAGKTLAEAVTLRGLLVGLAVLLLTFIAARNLPGLVEIGLLSRIHLDAPTRYAITSISRYVIVIGGMVTGLSLLGVRWGQLQWMAAALTVGLGFGLQEIFANFVSGLIVLFERPYRVGDIITIGEVEGTVTRIRTRATTVLDWDNKEVVVPNKTFITERFVNWTLSDAVTRVVLKIGVAYASDPERVRRLLLRIAESDPRVLRQPPPSCWLLSLGASTLDFELRVFVGEILDRNQVRHALYERIIAAFREEGIEIAFPQMDLWVRQASAAGSAPALEASSRPAPAG